MRAGLAVPVICYLAVALLVPLLRGAYAKPEFWHHAATVLGVVFLFCGAYALLPRKQRLLEVRDARLAPVDRDFPQLIKDRGGRRVDGRPELRDR